MSTRLVGQWNTGASATGKFVVGGNILYLPWNTGAPFPNGVSGVAASENPAGFTGLLSTNGPYLAYRVIGSACRVEVLPTVGGDTCDFVLSPVLGTTVHANYQGALQSKYSMSRLVSAANGATPQLSQALSTAEVVGEHPEAVIDEDDYIGLYNAAPTKAWSWEVWYATCDAAVLGSGLPVVCAVTYDVLLIHMNLVGSMDTVSTADRDKLLSSTSATTDNAERVQSDYFDADLASSEAKDLEVVSISSSSSSSSSAASSSSATSSTLRGRSTKDSKGDSRSSVGGEPELRSSSRAAQGATRSR